MELRDRNGTLTVEAHFLPGGALERAWVRIPDGSWAGVEPRATSDAPWGLSDRAWHAPRGSGPPAARPPADFTDCTELTVFEAIDWSHVDRIVPGAEPARLPPGAAPAVFNVIAALAAAQGVPAIPYRGPYASETLFLGLLESFRPTPDTDDPLAAFQAGDLLWIPAPHEPLFVAEDLYVQMRGRIEKVVWRGVTYHRPDLQAIARHAPRRVRDTPDGVRCGLWALGRPLVDHLVLSPDAEIVHVLDVTADDDEVVPAPAPVRDGVIATVVVSSLPPLGPSIREVAAGLALEWAPLDRDLARIDGDRVRVDTRLREALGDLIGATRDANVRAGLALAVIAEIAACIGDGLRGQAQALLASRPEAEQRAALAALEQPEPERSGEARAITAGVQALLATIAGG